MGEDVDQLEPPLYWRFRFTILHIFNLFFVFTVFTITDLYLIQSILAFLLFKDNIFLLTSPLHWAVAGDHLHIANLLVTIFLVPQQKLKSPI